LGNEASEVFDLDEEAAAVDGEDDGVDGFVVVLQLAAPVPRGFELWVGVGGGMGIEGQRRVPFSNFQVLGSF
jgi:hypothetical protein